MYIHELREWPRFTWRDENLIPLLAEVRKLQQSLSKELSELGFDDQNEASLRILTEDVVKTSEIEGEYLNPSEVRSSIARRLGLEVGGLSRTQRNTEGIVGVVINATKEFDRPLNEQRLYGWHSLLFPTGWSGEFRILVGQWRDDAKGPMQVVSGVMRREIVHFEAPGAIRLPKEMEQFIDWFERSDALDKILKAGIAHLYFVTIHPFDDGNGRIARALADLALARADTYGQRFYSMSSQIKIERKSYYEILVKTQKGGLDITEWLEWFLNCLISAIKNAQIVLKEVLRKARVWRILNNKEINSRQTKMLNRILDGDFDGALHSQKWAKMNDCSLDTAQRDLAKLVEYGILSMTGRARSTRYHLKDDI
jgi:Fic family protein